MKKSFAAEGKGSHQGLRGKIDFAGGRVHKFEAMKEGETGSGARE